MTKVAVFMNLRYVRPRHPCGTGHVVAEWHDDAGLGVVYTSKRCETEAEAIGLALRWKARKNREPSLTYVDVTTATENRFGYVKEGA